MRFRYEDRQRIISEVRPLRSYKRCRSRKYPRTVHPQFGSAIRGNYRTLAPCLAAAHAVRWLMPFAVSTDSTIGGLRKNQGRTLPNREVISGLLLSCWSRPNGSRRPIGFDLVLAVSKFNLCRCASRYRQRCSNQGQSPHLEV